MVVFARNSSNQSIRLEEMFFSVQMKMLRSTFKPKHQLRKIASYGCAMRIVKLLPAILVSMELLISMRLLPTWQLRLWQMQVVLADPVPNLASIPVLLLFGPMRFNQSDGLMLTCLELHETFVTPKMKAIHHL